MSRLVKQNENETLYSENGYQCLEKLKTLEDLEDELGCPIDVLFKALKDDTIRYKEWICEGISLYYNGNGKWCFSTSYQDMYGQTRYIDEIDVATYGIDWFLVD